MNINTERYGIGDRGGNELLMEKFDVGSLLGTCVGMPSKKR